jgi:tetratricopeptide (TPR) repeat protein
LLNHALELFQAAPKSTADALKTMRSLGDLYRKQDKLDKADEMLLRALTGCENELGSEHDLTLAVAYSLSLLYRILDKPGEAEKMCQRALKGYENIPAKDETTYSSMLAAMNTLGLIRSEQGREADAEKLYLSALELYEQFLGPEDPATLNTVNKLGPPLP